MTRNAGGASGVSEKRFRALLANVADMVTISDRDGNILYASPATEKVSGYTPEEFEAINPFDTIHPEDRPRCEEALARLVDNPGLSLELQHRVRRKDGTWGWVEGTFNSLFEDPDVGGLLATVQDITERKRREANQQFIIDLDKRLGGLRRPEEIEQVAIDSLSAFLRVPRCYIAHIRANERATVEREYRDAEAASSLVAEHRLSDFVSPEALEPYSSGGTFAISDVLADARSAGRADAYAALDIRAYLSASVIYQGEWVAIFNIADREPRVWREDERELLREIAARVYPLIERARAEEALRESEERLQKAIAIETVGVLFFDLDGHVTGANDAFCRMTGYSREELLGSLSWKDLTPPEFGAAVARAAEELGARGETAPYERQLVCKDGSLLWSLCAPRRLSGSGRESRCVEFVLDITERKRLETERARMKSREAAMRAEAAERERISRELHDRVAHSMGVVHQSLQLHKVLAEDAPERAREKLGLAEDTAKVALDQTRNLAIELRRSVSEETRNGVATALRTLLEASAPDGVDARFSFSGDESMVPPEVGAQVYLIMREAIRNAFKHAGDAGVKARLDIKPGELVGTVADDGEGFELAAFSVDGRGIGLRSMRERVEMVGGRLDLASRPGNGTTVEVRVPLKVDGTGI